MNKREYSFERVDGLSFFWVTRGRKSSLNINDGRAIVGAGVISSTKGRQRWALQILFQEKEVALEISNVGFE